MTSRQRNNPAAGEHDVAAAGTPPTAAGLGNVTSGSPPKSRFRDRRRAATGRKRRSLLETLEQRQLLAGPQLIGIQPNDGDLIVDGTLRDTAPQELTLRFDEDQVIDPATLAGVSVFGGGPDGAIGTADDVRITPGSIAVGENTPNEVIVRFAEVLPDDVYRVEVSAADVIATGRTALRNVDGEPLVPRGTNPLADTTDFELRLGALIEAVVPQPVIRNADGTLTQNRNEIVVYFNEDELFTENQHFAVARDGGDAVAITSRYAEDDPAYDGTTWTFTIDNGLTAPQITANADNSEITVAYPANEPLADIVAAIDALPRFDAELATGSGASTGFDPGAPVESALTPTSRSVESPNFYQLLLTGETVTTLDDVIYSPVQVVYDRVSHTSRLIFEDDINELPGVPVDGGTFRLRIGTSVDSPTDLIVSPTRTALGGDVGETLTTATDVGVFGPDGIASFIFEEEIEARRYTAQLPGSNTDPGHRDFSTTDPNSLARHINDRFNTDPSRPSTGSTAADIFDGVTTIPYNFAGIYETTTAGGNLLNQIDPRQQQRIREALLLWESRLGIQFRETADQGITIAVGSPDALRPRTGSLLALPTVPFALAGNPDVTELPSDSAGNDLDFSIRITPTTTDVDPPTFANAAIVFGNDAGSGDTYGGNFFRQAVVSIGFAIGLEAAPDLPPQTVMSLSSEFLNDSINAEDSITSLDPIFPGNFDILHGQHLYRPDSIDVDLYQFIVDLDDPDRTGTFTAETFAERLSESSLLDTTLTLFEEVQASAESDLGFGTNLRILFESADRGFEGNNARVEFVVSQRPDINVLLATDEQGNSIDNVVLVEIPRGVEIAPQEIVDAINADADAQNVMTATLVAAEPGFVINVQDFPIEAVRLTGGGVSQLARNDDYFSEDSRLIATLGAGTYFIGVAASGNNNYDPSIAGTGFGGVTQGAYELSVKFEPAVDEAEAIRDVDTNRPGVPGTVIDGDGDGIPGGVHNFWFQTRPLQRTVSFIGGQAAITPRQTVTIVGATGIERIYEFVPSGSNPSPGHVPVVFTVGANAQTLSINLRNAINGQTVGTGVTAAAIPGNPVAFTLGGERSFTISEDSGGIEVGGRTIFVDKTASPASDGTLAAPFNNIANGAIANAFGAALPGDIVRVVGNGGADNDITTEVDNQAYLIGVSETGGTPLEDGRNLEVPQGVTMMIDAGAAFKMRSSRLAVGSSTFTVDRSGSAVQILGTPRLVQLSPSDAPIATSVLGEDNASATDGFDDGAVIFTSLRDRDVNAIASGNLPQPVAGSWGGIVFNRDIDGAQGRSDREDQGIFLNRINHADIRYGGSANLLIDGIQALVNPIQMQGLRPTIAFNEIAFSADAALSATPDSFAEDSYQAPIFQQGGEFTSDYDRVGPDIYRNTLVENSVNGLFVRSRTGTNRPAESLTVAARFDDTTVVHYFAENLIIDGKLGGSIQDGVRPNLSGSSAVATAGGSLPTGNYEYTLTFVDTVGFESLPATNPLSVSVGASGRVDINGLPTVPSGGDYVARRLYRSDDGGATFRLVSDLDGSTDTFSDLGGSFDIVLDQTLSGTRGRLDASLVVDPGTVIKLRGARIELGFGANLIAEGTASRPIVMTSSQDDRFGAGGSFDSNNDDGQFAPDRGDWSGIYASPGASVSLDHAVIAYGGGISLIDGGATRAFNPLELQQAEGRITNTSFELNAAGQEGSGPSGRQGRLTNEPAVIYVRGSQPTIAGNTFIDNRGPVVSIDSEAFSSDLNIDEGRQTGSSDLLSELDDNRGPLIRDNVYLVIPGDAPEDRQISGIDIRAGVTVTTQSVFDDTDIVHMLSESLTVGNIAGEGGLRLISRGDESLVVKLDGGGNPNDPLFGTGFNAVGSPAGIEDRVGGSVHILGRPGAPVVLTSFADDTVGAGTSIDGSPLTDTNGDSFGSRPQPNDWRSIYLGQYSNDRNFDIQLEQELPTANAPGSNATVETAQLLGNLATSPEAGNEDARLGFEVEGFLSGPTDVDVYSFVGAPGTEVWIDIDRTAFELDTVVELIDASGNLIARSDDENDIFAPDPALAGSVTPLQASADAYTEFGVFGEYIDTAGLNPNDAGLHLALPGDPNSTVPSAYFIRVRSGSADPDDVAGGLTSGGYRMQLRLQEQQEVAGSIVRFTDIRYANHGVHVQGLPGSSPLLGEAQENESTVEPTNQFYNNTGFSNANFAASNDQIYDPFSNEITGSFQRPQFIGNVSLNKSSVLSVGGSLSSSFDGTNFTDDTFDVDFYQFDVGVNDGLTEFPSTIFDLDYAAGFNNRPDTRLSIFFDPDGDFGAQAPRLVYIGADSNVAEDQPSPGLNNDLIERLARGSAGTQDPFIGPVAVQEGTYYVAVTQQGVIPSELFNNALIRIEPIDSVERIVVDRIETQDGDTFGPTLIDNDPAVTNERLFDLDTATNFASTTRGSGDVGHGDPRDTPAQLDTEIFEFVDIGQTVATGLDIQTLGFSLSDEPDIIESIINDPFGSGLQFLPHTTVNGSLAGDQADLFTFEVTEDGTRVVLDIDDGYDSNSNVEDPELEIPFPADPGSIDTTLTVLNLTTGLVVGTFTESDVDDGRLGSEATNPLDDVNGDLAPLSLDPFADLNLDIGQYAFVVTGVDQTVAYDGTAVTIDGDPNPAGTYTVHASIENQPVGSGNVTNESIEFTGTADSLPAGDYDLQSENVDLSGYTAEDLPRLYFSYNYAAGGTDVTYTITAGEVGDADFVQLPGDALTRDGFWRQEIVELGAVAGRDDVRVNFRYTFDGIDSSNVLLDDFIIGFAERGEQVFGGRNGQTEFFGAPTSSVGGEYQLELRTGTRYTTSVGGTRVLSGSFDTNARHAREVTLIVPEASAIPDGGRFEISDGAVNQTFQFVVDNPGGSATGAIAVRIDSGDTPAEVADAIRFAIGLSPLTAEAAAVAGDNNGDFLDGRINLIGVINGSFDALESFTDAPAPTEPLVIDGSTGLIAMPAVLFDGRGDVNVPRPQGQVIIESNRISDAHAVGILSEPGEREVDSDDIRFLSEFDFFNPIFGIARNPFLQQPPVGNAFPGAVRNLPGDNDAVLGGLAPGVVIRNNTIDQAGFAGIKTDGEQRPFVITGPTGLNAGNIADGYLMTIDAAGTRVVFEFEDLAGADTNAGGSGQVGGDGYADGHVPIFYRHPGPGNGFYNSCDGPGCPAPRDLGYSSIEVMTSIMQAIQGSILVTNGLVELVTPYVGPNPFLRDRLDETGFQFTFNDDGTPDEAFAPSIGNYPNAAVYIYGASGIYDSSRYQKVGAGFDGGGSLQYNLAPIFDPVQPVATIVNNTIYGADGTEALAFDEAESRPNDLIFDALDTKLGRSHNGPYIQTAAIDPTTNGVDLADVDFYKVELVVGDRLIVDIDTPNNDVDTVVQIFDAGGSLVAILDDEGNPVTAFESGVAPGHLNPGTLFYVDDDGDGGFADADDNVDVNDDGHDPFVDFTALETGTYFVAVSSTENTNYDPSTLTGRVGGTGGAGDYTIAMEVYAPRSFVMSLDRGIELNGAAAGGSDLGITTADVVGTTFTVTQIPDFAPGTPNQPIFDAAPIGNQITFEFVTAPTGTLTLPNGNISVPLIAGDGGDGRGYRVPSIMRAIQEAVRGLQDPVAGVDVPTIPNHEDNNGPLGRSGPVTRGTATALGGISGDNEGIQNLNRLFGPMPAANITGGTDFLAGFGHDRRESGDLFGNVIPEGTLVDGDGTTELYVLWENISGIELSPEAVAAGLKLTPDNTRSTPLPRPAGVPEQPPTSRESDQLLAETGILIGGGASGTVINNVIVNAHQSIVAEETSRFGFGDRVPSSEQFSGIVGGNELIKPADIVVAGNAFQFDEPLNNRIRYDISFPIDIENPFDIVDNSLSTDGLTGATNIASDADDFNFVVDPDIDLLLNPAGNDFRPSGESLIIDSGLSSVTGRTSLADVYASVGLSSINTLAPIRDGAGILRVDNPNVSPPGGLGSNIFIDRGANELADFVGPVADLQFARDNDAAGIDADPTVSFLRLVDGVYDEFRIQLQDNGDASDPFFGSGVDDSTVVVPAIDGLRRQGANVVLFENDVILTEGIDYTFRYDQTTNVITLRPLAGIWRNDRSYRIVLNNQPRSVLVAPEQDAFVLGDQITITDSNGDEFVFEYTSGYALLVPEPITLTVPDIPVGGTGGLGEGQSFDVVDGRGQTVSFELDRNNDGAAGGRVAIPIADDDSAIELAQKIAIAIDSATGLDLDVIVEGPSIIIGAENGGYVTTGGINLRAATRTLGLRIPEVANIVDGSTFVVGDGDRIITFEFDSAGGIDTRNARPIDLRGLSTDQAVADAIVQAILEAPIAVQPIAVPGGRTVQFNLPGEGTASTTSPSLAIVSVSSAPSDGDTLTITPAEGTREYVLEINRTDERDATGALIGNDGVAGQATPVDVTRLTPAVEFAGAIANAVRSLPPIAGLSLNDLRVFDGGLLTIGGEEDLRISVTGQTMTVVGSPVINDPSRVDVFGPLLLNLSTAGGGAYAPNGQTVAIADDDGNDVVFEFVRAGSSSAVAGATPINYNPFDTVQTIAASLVTAINSAAFGVQASVVDSVGQISLGRIATDRLVVDGSGPGQGLPGAAVSRGLVTDGEVLAIRQNGQTFRFEFDTDAVPDVLAGNIAVDISGATDEGAVASALAATINGTAGLDGAPDPVNAGALLPLAVAETDGVGDLTGSVVFNAPAGTAIDIVGAPTLNASGVPGGVVSVRVSPEFGSTEVKQALISAINSINRTGSFTTLSAEDRGGATLFVGGATEFDGAVGSYTLPAIADNNGNPLEPNRDDLTTQFTLLLPTTPLDYGDAPNPTTLSNDPRLYPTLAANDGARHVIDDGLRLGSLIDADVNGLPNADADGDDNTIVVTAGGGLFTAGLRGTAGEIVVDLQGTDAGAFDGETIFIDTGVATATLEFNVDGIFDEDNFEIAPVDPDDATSIAIAIAQAIAESPIEAAEVRVEGDTVLVDADDEDGVVFTSDINPTGVISHGVATPIEVSVTGAGVVEAWIDFNGDGDWNDPGEQVLPMSDDPATAARRVELSPANLANIVSNNFTDTGSVSTRTFSIVVPPNAPIPTAETTVFARFRVSRDGGLSPDGLALSGEVEDYALTLLPGLPPAIVDANLVYDLAEDTPFQALDITGGNANENDNGLLFGITDPDGESVEVFTDDLGMRPLMLPNGEVAGQLEVFRNGQFTFTPAPNFFTDGSPNAPFVEFDLRVTDGSLVSPQRLNVVLNIAPENDAPRAIGSTTSNFTVAEDAVTTFTVDQLITGLFAPGPSGTVSPFDEADQALIFQAVSTGGVDFQSLLGGDIAIGPGGETLIYTPPANYNGEDGPDRFNFTVADVPGGSQTALEAATRGTVVIDITPVNDAPIANPDNFSGVEGQPTLIPITNAAGTGILDNDSPGPADEASQTLTLVDGPFRTAEGVATLQGGRVIFDTINGEDVLRYIQPINFSGIDQFTYDVSDDGSPAATGTGTVTINVAGDNDAPEFIGIGGESVEGVPVDIVNEEEAKQLSRELNFDLATWFFDPEGDELSFSIPDDFSSSVFDVSLDDDTGVLTVTLAQFQSGTETLVVTADDGELSASTTVTFNIEDTPDPPQLISPIGTINLVENETRQVDLGANFFDPDAGDTLTYTIQLREGANLSPIPNDHPLIDSITFSGDQMTIVLQPGAFGEVDLRVTATDGTESIFNDFSVDVANINNVPVAGNGAYNVPIGFQFVIDDPARGLLQFASDGDLGDTLAVVTPTGQPQFGSLSVDDDGTFSYSYTGNFNAGEVEDSFTYRVVDSTGAVSETGEILLNIGGSLYQNPLPGLEADVTGNGIVSPLDALRVINFLSDFGFGVPISEINSPPPDFVDVNGDGVITPADALGVIIDLSNAANNEGVSFEQVSPAISSSFAAASTSGLPSRMVAMPLGSPNGAMSIDAKSDLQDVDRGPAVGPDRADAVVDRLLTAGLSIGAAEATAIDVVDASAADDVDEALDSIFDDLGDNDSDPLDFD